MAADIADRRPSELELLRRSARRLRVRSPARSLPPLLFVTDPERTPEPWLAAARLPRGSGIVFRGFGRADALETGLRLKAVARQRGLVLLAGTDPRLAQLIGADGVHLPQRLAHMAGAITRARPGWLVTAAAHDLPAALTAARAGAHAVLVSPVFESRSPSAARPLGALRFAALVGAAPIPVYALGGVNGRTAVRLITSGAAGIAAVEALART
jgi:thiamine-phosphate pyrophosphorylase